MKIAGSSATVRMTTCGLVTSAPPMGNVMVMPTAHVGALKLFPQMESIVNQYIIRVSTLIIHHFEQSSTFNNEIFFYIYIILIVILFIVSSFFFFLLIPYFHRLLRMSPDNNNNTINR